MKKNDPREILLNRGTSRDDLLENYDNLLLVLEEQDGLRLQVSKLTKRMQDMREAAQTVELSMPREVDQNPVSSAAKTTVKDTKAFVPMALIMVGGSYVISKLCLSVPQDFLVIGGIFGMLLGMLFGLVAYWPLWIQCKILDIFTSFEVKPMMETLYGPVSGYLLYFAVGVGVTILLSFLLNALPGIRSKQKYKRDLDYYNENKEQHHENEKKRVREVLQAIEAFRPEYEAVRENFIAYDEAARGLFWFLRITDPKWQHKDAVLTMREYVETMRADNAREAVSLYADECRHKAELRSVQLAYEKIEAKNRSVELMRRLDEACARLDAENARAVMERTAKKAHNAAVYEDYKWHEMVGDISDMDTYAALKLMDLEL